MKKNTQIIIFIGLVVLVIVGCFCVYQFPQREGIMTERLGALISILNEPLYNDTQKMEIVSKMKIGDKRYKEIIMPSNGETNPVKQVSDLKALTQQILNTPN